MLITKAGGEGDSAGGVRGGQRRGSGRWGGVCVRLRLAIRQVGTQMAGGNKSIKANLPRLCNSFSIGGQYGEGGTVDMTHV